MALVAININDVKEYSLMEDTADDKTVFLIGVIDSLTRSYIDDSHLQRFGERKDMELNDVDLHDKYVQFVRFGLKGWRNMKDADGKDVEYKSEEKIFPRIGKRIVASDETLQKLDLKWMIEIGLEIVSRNRLTPEQQKNS